MRYNKLLNRAQVQAMDFATVRELRAESAKIWEKLEAGEDIVITRNGKPFALLVYTESSEVEEKLRALRGAKLRSALRQSRQLARKQDLGRMSMEEIDAEVAAARRERRQDAPSGS